MKFYNKPFHRYRVVCSLLTHTNKPKSIPSVIQGVTVFKIEAAHFIQGQRRRKVIALKVTKQTLPLSIEKATVLAKLHDTE